MLRRWGWNGSTPIFEWGASHVGWATCPCAVRLKIERRPVDAKVHTDVSQQGAFHRHHRMAVVAKRCPILPFYARKLRLVERFLQFVRPPTQRCTPIQTRRDRA